MKEFKYTIDGKEYHVEIGDISEETNVANVKVNGEAYEVSLEKTEEPEKKVVLGKPVAGWGMMAGGFGIALVLLVSGMVYFRRVERTLADIL